MLLAALNSFAAERFVDVNSLDPLPPYTNWAHAAVEIQQAIDAADAGDVIWVTNGIYQTGETLAFGSISNRVAATKPISLRSVNGPEFTIITGHKSYDLDSVRCVYLTNGASMSGFTLTNGSTSIWAFYGEEDESGAGVRCESENVFLTNCVIVNCKATSRGGGVYRGTLYHCSVSNNIANAGGGVSRAKVYDSQISSNSTLSYGSGGGGAEYSTLDRCLVLDNVNPDWGGAGVKSCAVTNSTLSGNVGGAAWESILVSCTVSNNSGGESGGVAFGTAIDCLIRDNYGGMGGGASVSALTRCLLIGNSGGTGGAIFSQLTNCTVLRNSGSGGGGTANSIVVNTALFLNSADYGGGSLGDNLFNCTVSGNTAREEGGGGYISTFYNCIVYHNQSPIGPNYRFDDYFGGSLNFCCTTPIPERGTNNFTADPQLADGWHLSPNSPCRGAGKLSLTAGLDLDGDAWQNPPSVGCDEFVSGNATGSISATILATFTNFSANYPVEFRSMIEGHARQSWWAFGDGQATTNRPYVTHSWTSPGNYLVMLWVQNETFPDGITATQMVHVTEGNHYVSLASTNPTMPYTSWATAATNIQDAVDAAPAGGTIFVNDGNYRNGARVVTGTLSNRVAITRPMTLRSLNGPAATIIEGNPLIGTQAVRCVYLTNGSALIGFTLTNGATATTGDPDSQQSGGGVWCNQTTNALISNCIFAGNSAFNEGGGAMHGTLVGCSLSNNVANVSGAVCLAGLQNCILTGNQAKQDAGAAFMSVLDGCLLRYNTAGRHGGAAASCILNRSLLTDNRCQEFGGAAYASTLTNSTVTGNTGRAGGGVNACTPYNCIVYYNSDSAAGNFWNCTFYYSDTLPLPESGTGNFTNAPLFLNGDGSDYRLQSNSPCINAGLNRYVTQSTDLDSNPRIIGGTVDVGAYEYLSPDSALSYAWLQQYGLPETGSADFLDPDGDGMNNWQEWRAQTNPTNRESALRMLTPSNGSGGLVLRWQSAPGVHYFLERGSALNSPTSFSMLVTNVAGQGGTTAFTDANVAGPGLFFYRVGIRD